MLKLMLQKSPFHSRIASLMRPYWCSADGPLQRRPGWGVGYRGLAQGECQVLLPCAATRHLGSLRMCITSRCKATSETAKVAKHKKEKRKKNSDEASSHTGRAAAAKVKDLGGETRHLHKGYVLFFDAALMNQCIDSKAISAIRVLFNTNCCLQHLFGTVIPHRWFFFSWIHSSLFSLPFTFTPIF